VDEISREINSARESIDDADDTATGESPRLDAE
jgi:hypothetical protein